MNKIINNQGKQYNLTGQKIFINGQWQPANITILTEKQFDDYDLNTVYNKGAIVKYNGKYWISTTEGNVWTPGDYGWEVIE